MKVVQSCPTLCNPKDCSPWNSPGQNTGVGSHSLLQGVFSTNFEQFSLLSRRRWNWNMWRTEHSDMGFCLILLCLLWTPQPYHFSVKAVRLNRRISWWRGSTLLAPSSSSGGSAPGFYKKVKYIKFHIKVTCSLQTQEHYEGFKWQIKRKPFSSYCGTCVCLCYMHCTFMCVLHYQCKSIQF